MTQNLALNKGIRIVASLVTTPYSYGRAALRGLGAE
jgi:hypothetical protein